MKKLKRLNLIMWLLVTSSVAIAQSISYMPNIDTQGQFEYQYGEKCTLKQTNQSPPPFGIDESLLHKQQSDARDCQYTSNAQLANLSISDLIAYLKSTPNYACHGAILFNYEEAYSPIIFSNTNIQAVANEMNNLALSYDGTYANGIYGIIYYLRIATYFDFYYPGTNTINQTSWTSLTYAINSMSNNSHMFDLNAEASSILDQFLILLDLQGIRSQPSTIDFVKQIMYNIVVIKIWQTTPDINLITCYSRIFYLKWRGSGDPDYISAIAADEDYITLWGSITVDTALINHPTLGWLFNHNAILTLANIAANPIVTNQTCPWLAMVCNLFPRLNIDWLLSVIAINDAGVCTQYNLCEDLILLMEEVKQMLFPYTYRYDDGKFIIRSKLQKADADNLYYATRQTQVQFFRLLQNNEALPGDTNDTLTSMIFESYGAYQSYAPILYNIPTNNGGMYMENRGEFYTWDRPSTSLSLEELFRHEFTHYLQGRYLIHGYWGEVAFYDNDRLTWFEEGNAELLTAATDYQGIRLREYTIDILSADYPNWPSLDEVLSSYYGQAGSIYYVYGNLLWFHWYVNDYAMIKTFFDLTINDDITGFDNLVNFLKTDPNSQTEWNNFLLDVYSGSYPAWDIETNWLDDHLLTVGTIEHIQNEFTDITGISNITVTTDADSIIRRFRISGPITGQGAASNNAEAALSVNSALDLLLIELKDDPYINNFDYTVAYFTDISYANNIPTATYNIMGSLLHPEIGEDPLADFQSPKNTLVGNPVDFISLSKGYIKSYNWSFPGGTPSSSTLINPTVIYQEPGSYDVTLTVTGPDASDTKTVNDCIKVYIPTSSDDYCQASSIGYKWISRVALNDIDNSTTGFPPNGYSDFAPSIATELVAGTQYPISIDLSYINYSYMNIGVWIDLNQNGLFTDTGEELLIAHPPQNTQLEGASITIPNNALNGVTRMRVRSNYRTNGIVLPCGYDIYMGEIEDYSIVIVGGITPQTLTINIVGDGNVNVNGSPYTIPITVQQGTSMSLAAIADPNWEFDSWTGDLVSTNPIESIVMDSDKTITATFTAIQHTLTINIVGDGNVNVNGSQYTMPITVQQGTPMSLAAIADPNWEFVNWTGDLVSTNPIESIVMNNDKTITATFTAIQHTLTINIVGDGNVNVNGSQYTVPITVPQGTSMSLTAIADPNWEFVNWTGDLVSTNPIESIVMDSDKIVTATFDFIEAIGTLEILNIQIFPNPFKNHITVTNTEDVIRINICNFLGQNFIDMQIKGSQTYIPTDILSPGIYLINIYKENKMVTKKIIKI